MLGGQNCIAILAGRGLDCVAIQKLYCDLGRPVLYCNTVTGPRHDAGQGGGRVGWCAWGAQEGGRRRRARARAGRAGGALGAQAGLAGGRQQVRAARACGR